MEPVNAQPDHRQVRHDHLSEIVGERGLPRRGRPVDRYSQPTRYPTADQLRSDSLNKICAT